VSINSLLDDVIWKYFENSKRNKYIDIPNVTTVTIFFFVFFKVKCYIFLFLQSAPIKVGFK